MKNGSFLEHVIKLFLQAVSDDCVDFRQMERFLYWFGIPFFEAASWLNIIPALCTLLYVMMYRGARDLMHYQCSDGRWIFLLLSVSAMHHKDAGYLA